MTATENSGNECTEPVSLPVQSGSVPPIVEIMVVLLLAVVPDIYSSFQSYLQPIAIGFFATHIWMIVRALQISAPVLLLIHLTGGNWQMHGLRNRPRLVDAAIAVVLVGAGYLAGGNGSRVEQDARSGFAVQAGINGVAEPLVDGTFLEAAGF